MFFNIFKIFIDKNDTMTYKRNFSYLKNPAPAPISFTIYMKTLLLYKITKFVCMMKRNFKNYLILTI